MLLAGLLFAVAVSLVVGAWLDLAWPVQKAWRRWWPKRPRPEPVIDWGNPDDPIPPPCADP